MNISKTSVRLLIILNILVLLGQVWPDGAPPFARWINILFLAANLSFLIFFQSQNNTEGQ